MSHAKLLYRSVAEGCGLKKVKEEITLSEFSKLASSAEIKTVSDYSEPLAEYVSSKCLMIKEDMPVFRAVFDNGIYLEFTGEKNINGATFNISQDPEWVKWLNENFIEKD